MIASSAKKMTPNERLARNELIERMKDAHNERIELVKSN